MADILPFNPLDKVSLGASVAEALLKSTSHQLGGVPEFSGAGIYAIYYCGKFSAYSELVKHNSGGNLTAPIYVGKAIPSGARKGGGLGIGGLGKSLFLRLREHATSIGLVSNLELRDFHCRFLVVDDIWIPLGESLIIARCSPIWNTLIDGFGNHDPGKGRHKGMRPRWDVLHPGRPWAERCTARKETASDIEEDVKTFLRGFPFPATTTAIDLEV